MANELLSLYLTAREARKVERMADDAERSLSAAVRFWCAEAASVGLNPPEPPQKPRPVQKRIPVTPQQARRWRRIAHRAGYFLSCWARAVVLAKIDAPRRFPEPL